MINQRFVVRTLVLWIMRTKVLTTNQSVRTLVRWIMRTKVLTTNQSDCGCSSRRDIQQIPCMCGTLNSVYQHKK